MINYDAHRVGTVELRRALTAVEMQLVAEFNLKSVRHVPAEIRRRSLAGKLRETPLVSQWLSLYSALLDALEEALERDPPPKRPPPRSTETDSTAGREERPAPFSALSSCRIARRWAHGVLTSCSRRCTRDCGPAF